MTEADMDPDAVANTGSPIGIPEYRAWSLAAVKLLQDVVYDEDEAVWNELLSGRSHLQEYFARIGLVPVVDETNGFAYLRQLEEEQGSLPEGYEKLPKLLRRSRLGFELSLMCVLLRDELRRFEEEEVDSQRCVIDEGHLLEQWQAFFPPQQDEQKQYRGFLRVLKSASEMGFVRQVSKEPSAWEVRRILKARLDAQALEDLHAQLLAKAAERKGGPRTDG